MDLTWSGYQYRQHDGYGKYGTCMIKALLEQGVNVIPVLEEELNMPLWMQEMRGLRLDSELTISCLPPYFVQKAPGRHWLLSMTEGSELPQGWRKAIENADIERVIVPCQHNADAFREGGIKVPIHVIQGGIDPDEFPLVPYPRETERPYTFLALADRGNRKGWFEAYNAFFLAFGSAKDNPDVRLIIKCKPHGNALVEMIVKAEAIDPRLTFLIRNMDMNEFYAMGDCFVIPSRSEGWGLPHRECAAKGLPVITQAYSGMDDGHTHEWAIVVEQGHMQPIGAAQDSHIKGDWRVVDIDELAAKMRYCYEQPYAAHQFGRQAAKWLFLNQTWMHSAQTLIELLQREHVLEPERIHA